MNDRFLTQAQADELRKRAGEVYDSLAARGSYDWLSAYLQAIDETTMQPGDPGWCGECDWWSPYVNMNKPGPQTPCKHENAREGYCPKGNYTMSGHAELDRILAEALEPEPLGDLRQRERYFWLSDGRLWYRLAKTKPWFPRSVHTDDYVAHDALERWHVVMGKNYNWEVFCWGKGHYGCTLRGDNQSHIYGGRDGIIVHEVGISLADAISKALDAWPKKEMK